MKGESSGHIQVIKEAYFDCDKDALLFKVKQTTAACHTGNYSCFFNKIDKNYDIIEEEKQVFSLEEVYSSNAAILQELYQVVVGRKENRKEGSYTSYLFEKGLDKILKKIGEEESLQRGSNLRGFRFGLSSYGIIGGTGCQFGGCLWRIAKKKIVDFTMKIYYNLLCL
jgi:hypothetical protein